MDKKTRSRTETLLFVFGISFAVFILLFMIIATVIALSKNHRKGGSLVSLLQSTLEDSSQAIDSLQSEAWPAQAATQRSEDEADHTDAKNAKRRHAHGDLH